MTRMNLFAGAVACLIAAALVGWAMVADCQPEDLFQIGKIEAIEEVSR